MRPRVISSIASMSVALSADARRVLAGAHDVAHVREELAAERAAGMRARELVPREAFRVHQRDRERVAERERGGRARRRREVQRAGFLLGAA